MKLADIASKAKLDISTISRFSNSKYIEAHFGTFKIKEYAFKKLIESDKRLKQELKSETFTK